MLALELSRTEPYMQATFQSLSVGGFWKSSAAGKGVLLTVSILLYNTTL